MKYIYILIDETLNFFIFLVFKSLFDVAIQYPEQIFQEETMNMISSKIYDYIFIFKIIHLFYLKTLQLI